MSYLGKAALTAMLRPAAALAGWLNRGGRLWAHARLASEMQGRLDPSVVVLGVPEVHGTRRIRLGRNLLLYPGLYLETRGEGEIEIGDNVVLSRGVHIVAYSRVAIGAGSMIGEYSGIRDADHVRSGGDPIRDNAHTARPIRIGSNVWIGRAVSVLSGTSIGDDATIGANSVVTRDIEGGIVAVGVPARPLSKFGREAVCEPRPSRGLAHGKDLCLSEARL